MNPKYSPYLPAWIAAGLGAVYMVIMMVPPGDASDKMHLEEAARLPVVEGGRVMPLDTIARNSLMIISGRQSFVDEEGKSHTAVEWLLDVMVTVKTENDIEGPAANHKVFRIENDQVLSVLGLTPRKGFRYSLNEILRQYTAFLKQHERVLDVAPKDRDLFDSKIHELALHLKLFWDLMEKKSPLVIPPLAAGQEWSTLPKAFAHRGRSDPATLEFFRVLRAYADKDTKKFNSALESYQKLIDKHLPAEASKTDFEAFINHFAPFYNCALLYVFVLVLACVSWIAYPQELGRAALGLACVALAFHTFALLSRMYLMDRPLVFVTNLYSSAVFIGWICVILGLVLERFYHNGVGCFVSAVTGSLTLVVGHYLATTGDTLEMMQAVLDTNFWLATHVTSVTIGYSATFVAGFLGMFLILRGVFTRTLTKESYKVLGGMIYGVVCFAMLFSFVGTVLGGIWADQSWGRFWGWDPKENGALLIVLMNALILHARWGGMVQQRGMAVLAVCGNIMTSWSWFGVNMLGVGLHNYGFVASHLFWLLTFVGSQLVVIGIGLVPLRLWPSFANPKPLVAGAAVPAVTTAAPTAVTATAPAPPLRRRSRHYKAKR
jgi:ABC-type transport system involved in cytochrome c biogenesis permease subunit